MVGLAWDRHPNSNKNQLGRRKGPRAPHNSKPRRANPIRCEGSRVTLLALVPSLPGPRAKARYLSKVIQSTEDLFAPSSVWTAGFCKHAAFGAARRCLHAPFGGRGSGRDEWFTQESLLTPAPSGVMSVFPLKALFIKIFMSSPSLTCQGLHGVLCDFSARQIGQTSSPRAYC